MEYIPHIYSTYIDDVDDESNDLDGQYYSFISPLEEGVFFSIPPNKSVPNYYSPIVDEDEGLCVGYMYKDMSTLYNIYDYNGNFVNRFEPPLETPWLDPLDLILMGPILLKGLRFGPKAFKLISRGEIIARGSSFIAEHWVSLLRGRMKWGLSPQALKFTAAPARHMAEAGRYVPLGIIELAIRHGRRLPDVVGKSGRTLMKYEIKLTRWNLKGSVNKEYTLEVVVDESTWTITHYKYE